MSFKNLYVIARPLVWRENRLHRYLFICDLERWEIFRRRSLPEDWRLWTGQPGGLGKAGERL